MKKETVIRAWRDEEFRRSLTDRERAMLPDHPAGLPSVMDDETLASVTGGCGTFNESCMNTSSLASCSAQGDTCI